MLRISGAGGWIGGRLLCEARTRGQPAAAIGRDMLLDVRAPLADAAGAAVVHLAAIAHRPVGQTGRAEFERVNRDVAVSLAERARDAGALRFVFVGTAAVMPPGSTRPWTEADAPDARDPYSCAKLAAERQLWALHEPGRFDIVVLRPPLVYGPGARANFDALLRWAASGRSLPLAAAVAPRSMVFIDNLVDALLYASAAPQAAGRTFFVTDGTERSVAQWIRAIRARLGMPARLFALPPALLAVAASVVGRQSTYERLFLPMQVDGSALHATGWQPPVAPEEALDRTLEAWRAGSR